MKVAVAGAGVAGCVTALEAIGRGWSVTMFDSSTEPRCSATAAGMLSPWAELETAHETIFELGIRSLDRWPVLLRQLSRPVFFQREGSLLTAHHADLPLLRNLVSLIERRGGKRLPSLSAEELLELEPELSGREAFFLPHEGQIDAQGFLEAAGAGIARAGDLRNGMVKFCRAGEVALDGGSVEHFDWVFDCRGLGAKPQMPELRGVRGEIIRVHAPEVSIRRPVRLMHPRYRVYIVPRPDHLYLVGATEIEAEDRSPVSVRSTLELLSALFAVQPAFAEGRIVGAETNLRPAFGDNQPRVEQADGITRINGLFRHGFLIAPALVEDAFAAVAGTEQMEAPVHAVH